MLIASKNGKHALTVFVFLSSARFTLDSFGNALNQSGANLIAARGSGIFPNKNGSHVNSILDILTSVLKPIVKHARKKNRPHWAVSKIIFGYSQRTLYHFLFDLCDCLGWIQTLGASFCTVHNRVTAVQFEWVL